MLNLKKESLHHSRINPDCKCLKCGIELSCATSADDKQLMPDEGSISICISCGNIAKFDENLCLEPLEDGLLEHMERVDPKSFKLVMDAVRLIKERNHG